MMRIATRPRAIAVALAASLALAASFPAAASEPLEFGFTGLYREPRITIVYPTDPAAAAATARRSATFRAEFLRAVHGIEVEVVADDRVSGAELAGNLLVLGWTNRVLGGERAPRPFVRDAGGLVVGGTLRFDRGADLAFVHVSPFNPERRLYFWSRIDPELDRSQLLPTEGSEWIVYRRYLPIAQGMWTGGAGWPPTRDVDAEIDHRPRIEERLARLGKIRVGRYDVVHDPAVFDAATVETIGAARNRALEEAASGLGVTVPEDFRVELHLYADGDAKLRATGITAPVHAVPRDRELHVVASHGDSANAHEEYHLVAHARFGPCASSAMFEGIVVSREGGFGGAGLPFIASALARSGHVPTVETLLDEGRIRALPAEISFPASAFLVRWLASRAGEDTVRALYTDPAPDLETVAQVTGLDPAGVEASFRDWVGAFASGGQSEYDARMLLETARERQLAGDFEGVVEALRNVLDLRPDEPQTLFNLASAQMRTGEYDDAERNLREVLTFDLADDDPLRVFGHYQLGRLYDIRGERERAVTEYRAVLALPDVHDSHRSAQDALRDPYTPERLE